MRRIILIILGLFTFAGICNIVYLLFNVIACNFRWGCFFPPLETLGWFIIPTLLIFYLFYKGLKNPDFFDKYRKTFLFFIWGIIITTIISLISTIIVFIQKDYLGLLVVTGIALIGIIISFILAFIGWIFDRKSNKNL